METENTSIPFSDLAWQWRIIENAFLSDFTQLASDGHFCLGPAVEQFEQAFSSYVGARHAIGVNSGTSALHLALIAAGIQKGDKVLIPAQTFIATAWPLLYLGATPILCDVEPETGNIDVFDAEKRLLEGTKAIIPVHLYGQPANMRRLLTFAAAHQLKVIEDACQAHGAYYGNKAVGTLGLLGCYSFYPGKNLGALGEGGMIVTNDDILALRLRALRHHAQQERYLHQEIGFNYRMEGIQALALSHKLKHLSEWNRLRISIAKRYITGLSGLPIDLPHCVHHTHVYHLFVIRTKKRNKLRKWLSNRKIATGLHYPIPLHRQPCFKHLNFKSTSFPIADVYANNGLSLPLFAGMTESQVDWVISSIQHFFERYR